ncbi:hypothetical protein KAR10_01410 [bacterium]|nr:hypothetical protein [bacterium]
MPTKHFLLAVLVVLTSGDMGFAQSSENNPGNFHGLQEIREEQPALHFHMKNIRRFHETGVFFLKRYATLEALITALDQGETENQAFGIGAASLIPGTGQMINEDYLQGGLLLFATGLSFATIRQLEYTRQRRKGCGRLLPWYYSALAVRNGIMTYAMLQASHVYFRDYHDRTAAMWTGAASILPGVGQAINGDWWEAGGLFITWSLASVFTARLETQIFINDDEAYLVNHQEKIQWSIAWLPGGGMGLNLTTVW